MRVLDCCALLSQASADSLALKMAMRVLNFLSEASLALMVPMRVLDYCNLLSEASADSLVLKVAMKVCGLLCPEAFADSLAFKVAMRVLDCGALLSEASLGSDLGLAILTLHCPFFGDALLLNFKPNFHLQVAPEH